ncbi:sodium:calcium antiporter [Egicoccus sp. AB-alg2]|uniref:sodium:calcium antiporter n=1 Tax=Egicoccus sp. AB-alg2 TaxID=3242693 RepID=UPI00359D514F
MPLLPVPFAIVALLLAAAGIMLAGPRMVRVADRLADLTGLGEAFVGAVLVGAATSLPDILATVIPAARGLPELAVGNALGGVLGQTAFLAVADLTYRRANLEHAAASLPNLVQATLLITLLGGVLALLAAPEHSVLGIHPGSLVLVGTYAYGLKLVNETSTTPMWHAVETSDTNLDVPEEATVPAAQQTGLWWSFAGLAVVLGIAGTTLAVAGESLVVNAGWQQAAVGVFLTGIGSSLAELVVSIAAIRAGALTLAVGNVIGGNTFDTLLIVAADVAYRDGPVYAAVGSEAMLVTALALVATAVIALGLLRRERHGVGNIGMESVVVLGLYAVAVVAIT